MSTVMEREETIGRSKIGEKYIIEILGLAGTVSIKIDVDDSKRSFVKDFDPDYQRSGYNKDKTGMLYSTNDPNEAKQFNTVGEAYLYYQQQSNKLPFREDGRPNRPLTAFTIEIIPLHEVVKV